MNVIAAPTFSAYLSACMSVCLHVSACMTRIMTVYISNTSSAECESLIRVHLSKHNKTTSHQLAKLG